MHGWGTGRWKGDRQDSEFKARGTRHNGECG